ncbi:MAG: hypothetical protein ABIS51_18675 [Sphingomonas sp.]
MATLASGSTSGADGIQPAAKDRTFFLVMAIAIASTTIAGFVLQLAMGRSSFGAPWWVHVHGVTFMGWLFIYLAQNLLVASNNLALHRRLGWFAACYVAWMVAVGLSVNTLAAIHHRIPFFFQPNIFLVMDWLSVLLFAGLTWAGVRMRGRTDWHRRLMLCAAILIMAPGIGRILPMPLLGEWQLWTIWLVQLVYLSVALVYDVVTRGRIHPAYVWGFGAITLTTAVMRPLAFTPPMLALTAWLMA